MPQPKPAETYRKNCTLCNKPRDVLVRCQLDEASLADTDPINGDAAPDLKPGAWHFVCPGSCWKLVSGGVIDGDLKEGREGYRYGGMWKNKHAGVSAKVPRRLKGKLGRDSGGQEAKKDGKDGSEEGEGEAEAEDV
jgi:hypothetical protein